MEYDPEGGFVLVEVNVLARFFRIGQMCPLPEFGSLQVVCTQRFAYKTPDGAVLGIQACGSAQVLRELADAAV